MIIRHPKPHEKETIIDLWRYSFHEDSENFISHYFDHVYKESHTLVAVDQNKIVSAMQCNPCHIVFDNVSFSVPYIVGISSFPEARSRGAGKATFSFLFKKYTAEKLPFAVLMAIDYGLYEPYGFAHVYDKYLIKGHTASLQKNKMHDTFYRITESCSESELEALSCFYNACVSLHRFSLKRTVKAMRTVLLELTSDYGFAYVCKNDQQEITGYIFYYISGKTMVIKEYHAANSHAHESIMRFIYNHNTQYPSFEIRDEKPGLSAHYLPDRRSADISVLPFLTIRIFDLPALFSAINIGKHFPNPFALKVKDPQVSENNQIFILSAQKKVSVSTETDTDYDLVISISLLTQLLFGFYDQPSAFQLLARDNPDTKKIEAFLKILSAGKSFYFNEYV